MLIWVSKFVETHSLNFLRGPAISVGRLRHKEGMQECKIKRIEINTELASWRSKQEIYPQKCFPLKPVNAKQHKGKKKTKKPKNSRHKLGQYKEQSNG